jgi:actin-like ATPase involved in cell morphogenesis
MNPDHANANAIGLDVGTSRIVAATPASDPGAYRFASQLNAFVAIPFSKLTAMTLQRQGIPHTIRPQEIVVHGNESERFADLMNTEIRRPMTHGTLDAKEPDAVAMLRQIIEALAPGEKEAKPRVCFTVPAAPLGGEESLTYHETTVRQLLEQMGYETRSINEGLAVVYGELESTNYTGIGISCGGGLCNVCFSYLSVPVLSFSIAKAGDYIDNSAASMIGERANRIRLVKEGSFHFNGFFTDKVQQVISVYYDDMIKSLVSGLKEAFANARNMPRLNRPVPLVLSGGTALPEGFRQRFEKIYRESDVPVELSEVRLAANPLETAAKGALIAALAEM